MYNFQKKLRNFCERGKKNENNSHMILDIFSENWNHSIIESSKRQNAFEKNIIADGNNSYYNT
jgi:hypothetical protein